MATRLARILLAVPLIPLLAAAADNTSRKVILIVGPPGGGKTTQAKKLSQKYGIPSISLPDLLKENSGWGKAGRGRRGVKAAIESGELANDEVADQLMRDRLLRNDAQRGFILDGYPSTSKQADNLETLLKERGLPSPIVVHLEVPDDVAIKRMKSRHRADDDPKTMQRRLAEFHRESTPILERYKGDRVITVNGAQSEKEVWRSIETALAESR
jgi:adenylate kinase